MRKPTPKMLRLRALAPAYEPEECWWCRAIRAGVTDSTAIPKPSAPQCAFHKALNEELSTRLRHLGPEGFPVEDSNLVWADITERGLEPARRAA